MRQYQIWNNVKACIYKSSKSYGVKDIGEVEVNVGSSSSNSHLLVKHAVYRKRIEDKIHFRFKVDGILVKEMIFSIHNNKPKDLLKTISYL